MVTERNQRKHVKILGHEIDVRINESKCGSTINAIKRMTPSVVALLETSIATEVW